MTVFLREGLVGRASFSGQSFVLKIEVPRQIAEVLDKTDACTEPFLYIEIILI